MNKVFIGKGLHRQEEDIGIANNELQLVIRKHFVENVIYRTKCFACRCHSITAWITNMRLHLRYLFRFPQICLPTLVTFYLYGINNYLHLIREEYNGIILRKDPHSSSFRYAIIQNRGPRT